jgi:mannitol 2-dehydrogenase
MTAVAADLRADPDQPSRADPCPYDRSRVTAGIVHFGVGGFHRSHQAVYVDRLLRSGEGFEWGICGIGVLPSDQRMRDVLRDQDHLYTLMVRHPDGLEEAVVIGSIVNYLYAPDDPEAVITKLADPATKIVSLTITEGGYNIHRVTGKFDTTNPAFVAEVSSGGPPSSAFGLITAGLARRREAGVEPFTICSCDNIPGNGDIARSAFASYARMVDPGLGDWVESQVAFPNSMVDRITPATTPADVEHLREAFSVADAWPVVCEPFEQWALEDKFPTGRPAYENVGVQMVADVEPYELMKLRLLNAGHQALGYFGYLLGHRLVHDAAQDPPLARFVRRYMDEEGTPTLHPVPGIDLEQYKDTLMERFSNAYVRDQVQRLCLEASDRIPKFVLPVVFDQLAANRSVRLCAAIVASCARYCEGVDEAGEPIEINDNIADELRRRAANLRNDPLEFLRNRDLFGDLVDEPRFVGPYQAVLDTLHAKGARATLESL